MTTTNIANALAPATPLQDGAFILDEVLGEGGFGITYRAHEIRLNRLVAIKEFFPTGCARAENQVQFPGDMSEREQHEARHNFLNEARILARLRHPHIVGVYTTFEENNTAYMVMEYLEGQTLQEMVQESADPASPKRPLPESEALDYIEQVGDALRLVHNAHLIHRDVKPENI
ncbi:MAG: serine/threonine protein kinase, partial [Abitibacteriaceae bacterium]|nr:serine/threonine protein kinase [Abditibacteriaceae bacterium]